MCWRQERLVILKQKERRKEGGNIWKRGREERRKKGRKRGGKGWNENTRFCTIALISHASNVMLKILQARLQTYINHELPDVQAGFRKGRGTRDQIANIHWIIEKARELQKNIYFCFIDYAKAFDCVGHNKLWKILKEMGIPDHLTYPLRHLYAGQEATVRTGHGTMDWFHIGKEYMKAVYCHHAYLTYMQSTSWEILGWKKHNWNQDCWEKYQ